MRDAENKNAVKAQLESALGKPVSIISGDEEAALTFAGTAGKSKSAALIDIGGGSTEYISGSEGIPRFRKSIDMGVIRFSERFFSTFPVSDREQTSAAAAIKNNLQTITEFEGAVLYAPAGTPTALAAWDQGLTEYDREKIDGYCLSVNKLERLLGILCLKSEQELTRLTGVDPRRALLLPMGTLILLESVRHFNFKEVVVSAKGLRYGVLDSLKEAS